MVPIYWATELLSSGRKEEEGDHQSEINVSAAAKKAIGPEIVIIHLQDVVILDLDRLREEDILIEENLLVRPPEEDIQAVRNLDQGHLDPLSDLDLLLVLPELPQSADHQNRDLKALDPDQDRPLETQM